MTYLSPEDDEPSTPDDDFVTPDDESAAPEYGAATDPTAPHRRRTGPAVARVAAALVLVLAIGVTVAAFAMSREPGNATMAVVSPSAVPASSPPGAVTPSEPAPPAPFFTFILTAMPTEITTYLDGTPVLELPTLRDSNGKPIDLDGAFACGQIRRALVDTREPTLGQKLWTVVEFGPDSTDPQVAADSRALNDRLHALEAAEAAGQSTVQPTAAVVRAGTDLEAACAKAGLAT